MLQLAAIILFSGLFAYFAWRNLLLAISTTVAFLPTYLLRFSIGFLPLTALEIMILIIFAVWAVQSKINRKKLSGTVKILTKTNWSWLVCAWLVFAAISLFISPNVRSAAGIFKAYFVEPILFLLVLINVIKTKKDLELLFYALGISALYVSAFAIYQKFTGVAIPNPIWQAAETRRVTSFYGYPNAIGLYLAPIITLYAGWLIDKLKIFKPRLTIDTRRTNFNFRVILFQITVIASSAAAIVFARSEGGYVGVLAGLFFLGVATKKLRWPTLAAATILILVITLVPQFKNYAWQQITFQNDSGKVRLIMWKETWAMLKDRAFSGAGLAGYQENFAPYHKAKYIEIYLYPHSLFLNFWSELGLGGLIVFLLIATQFFIYNSKKIFENLKPKNENSKPSNDYRWLRLALMASMVTILVHGLVDVPYFKNDLSVFFWLIVALSLVDFKK